MTTRSSARCWIVSTNAELPSWNVDAENLTDDQECECGEDTAVIRNDPDSTNWRIEEKELDVQVAVRVAGGLVQEVYSNADVGVDVYDLDVSDFPDEGEQEAADQKEAELDELVKSPGWRAVWYPTAGSNHLTAF